MSSAMWNETSVNYILYNEDFPIHLKGFVIMYLNVLEPDQARFEYQTMTTTLEPSVSCYTHKKIVRYPSDS